MKKSLLTLSIFLSSFWLLQAQTAVNFNCNDCDGNNVDFFTEIESGKVIVLDWVMPCSSCRIPTSVAYNIVQDFKISNPGKVFMYIADDYANTTCQNLKAWTDAYGFTDATLFSNSSIKMTDYGTNGMPKIIVVGCWNKQVFFNQNNTVDSTILQAAVQTALACATGVQEAENEVAVSVYPNPAVDQAQFTFTLPQSAYVQVDLLSIDGKKLHTLFQSEADQGFNSLPIPVHSLPAGHYLLQFTHDAQVKTYLFTRQ